jgi:NAD(P)H dehydrogenase (quinone)
MSIAITGASGRLGRLTAEALLDKVDPSEVVLVTRNPDALAELAARGADVRAGDFDDPASLEAAFAGVDRLLLISASVIGARVAQHRAAIDAAVGAGVRSVAYTSIGNPSHSNPGAAARDHRETEEALLASGLAWTFLRNGIYAEMLLLDAAPALASGKLLTNHGDGRTAYVSRADCAEAAAVVLTTDGHDGKAYDITSSDALSQADVAALFAELGGRPVEPVHLDDEAWVAAMVEHAGMPEPAARAYATFGIAARRGYLGAVSQTLPELTGREPASVREVLEAHRDELAGAPSPATS